MELEDELKKATKKAIYPEVTVSMLAKNEQIKKALQKKNVTLETIAFLRQSLTSFAELFAQIS